MLSIFVFLSLFTKHEKKIQYKKVIPLRIPTKITLRLRAQICIKFYGNEQKKK